MKRYIYVLFTVCFISTSVHAEKYVIHEIDRLSPGSVQAWPYAMNNLGQVVGFGDIGNTRHGFVWDLDNGVTDLGDLPGGEDLSAANDINNLGQIVGGSQTATGQRAVLWDIDGSMIDLGELPGGQDHSEANSINDLGQIAGTSQAVDGPHPVIWNNQAEIQDLGLLPQMITGTAYSLNKYGQVAGMASDGNILTAFKWDSDSGLADLGDLPTGSYQASYGFAINDDGYIAGRGNITAGDRGVLWRPDGSIQELTIFPDGINSYAYDINKSGFIVGDTTGSFGHRAVIWNDPKGLPTDLNNQVPPMSGWILVSAYGINDVGQITGVGITPAGLFSGFMLSPEPSVTSIWPADALAGETLFVFGEGFVPSQTQVLINSAPMGLVQWVSPELLIVRLPPSVNPGPVEVITQFGTGVSPIEYGSTQMGIGLSGIWPERSPVKKVVFVFGSGFSVPDVEIRLNNQLIQAVQVVNDSLMLFLLPAGMESGLIEVSTQEETVVSNKPLVIL